MTPHTIDIAATTLDTTPAEDRVSDAAQHLYEESGTFWGRLCRERHEIRCLDRHLACRGGGGPRATAERPVALLMLNCQGEPDCRH